MDVHASNEESVNTWKLCTIFWDVICACTHFWPWSSMGLVTRNKHDPHQSAESRLNVSGHLVEFGINTRHSRGSKVAMKYFRGVQ